MIRFICLFLLIKFLCTSFLISSQTDFNNYKNLICVGEAPTDFSELAYEKIKIDLKSHNTQLKGANEALFLENVHYEINALLHSGFVVYGDPVSNYIGSIADKLLEKDPELRKKLRFYTVKSNETNAFSTYQGIIFVTTGLLSQITNEAQLAFILAHEISHFSKGHVVEFYDFESKNIKNKKNANNDRIKDLSNFSKENEFEADKLGLKMFQEAGYGKQACISTFDVLLFSHLPFEEETFPSDYFNSEFLTINEDQFNDENYAISSNENFIDTYSSHPNIKARKEVIQKEIEKYNNWGETLNFLGEDRFLDIRNICRFENIRNDIIDAKLTESLYSIFLLEKSYPNSLYLSQMKAKTWLAIAQYKSSELYAENQTKRINWQGKIAKLYDFLDKLSKTQAITIAMRINEDLRKANASDPVIEVIWDKVVKTLAKTNDIYLSTYSKKTYQQAYQEFLTAKNDTLKKKDLETHELNKLERIKSKQKEINIEKAYPTNNYYIYALTDLIDDPIFNERFTLYRNEVDSIEKARENYSKLSYRKREKMEKRKAKTVRNQNLNALIFLEPAVRSYGKHDLDRIKSEKLSSHFNNGIVEAAKQLKIKVTAYSSSNMNLMQTKGFNDQALLKSYFYELYNNEGIELFPTDYNALIQLKKDCGTDKVMLAEISHYKDFDMRLGILTLSIMIYPLIYSYLPAVIMTTNVTWMRFIILDITKGEVLTSFSMESSDPINKSSVKARVYHVMRQLKAKPKNNI